MRPAIAIAAITGVPRVRDTPAIARGTAKSRGQVDAVIVP